MTADRLCQQRAARGVKSDIWEEPAWGRHGGGGAVATAPPASREMSAGMGRGGLAGWRAGLWRRSLTLMQMLATGACRQRRLRPSAAPPLPSSRVASALSDSPRYSPAYPHCLGKKWGPRPVVGTSVLPGLQSTRDTLSSSTTTTTTTAMFFKLVTVLCLAAAAMALPQRPVAGGRGKDAVIVSATNDVNFDGSYRYSFETSDGQRASQEGALKQVSAPGPDGDGLGEAVRGDFSYTDDAGNQFAIQYTADENGYVPQGAHLPTPPPIPEAIQKALAYIASQPQARS
ncbi:uncharacterized protein LOC126101292 [Schistocerca cancellata]|uniref:uncharacterized protein LOC126101292 n=2 Tax=Schistocerca TaxID=7008 RepID=UPI0021187CB0|nr:uncharacterized protein LOC126101292 [Schistocerca cancellata]